MTTKEEPYVSYYKSRQALVENALKEAFPKDLSNDPTVVAAYYSLQAGGKRVRPMLMFMFSEMIGVPVEEVMPFAMAIEMIHTYSLIHDDLPCMDDDCLRRGKPTCHIANGESFALLAGDALMNRAFEILFDVVVVHPEYAVAAAYFAKNAGIVGMIGGQSIDLASEGKKISTGRLCELHEKKTGALINASVLVPYYLYLSTHEENIPLFEAMMRFAKGTGLAFQIKDDLLDVQADQAILGKSVGKDNRDSKSTFLTLFGEKKAQEMLNSTYDEVFEAIDTMRDMGYRVSNIRLFSEQLQNRVQ
ncbi:MAG TPA: polyprenyl synthetase family protein [Bacillota bacterium]|nr:polyprenyl synthetase family protein [Bacillota bacterium]